MLYDANKTCLIFGHRYRKSVEELQKNSDKKVALLTKAETIVCIIFKILSVGKKWGELQCTKQSVTLTFVEASVAYTTCA